MDKFLWKFRFLLEEAGESGDKGGGGGGAGDKGDKGGGADDLASLKAQNESLMKRLEALEKGGKPKDEDLDLAGKAALDREKKTKDATYAKKFESALKFNMEASEWAKTNASLLPTSIQGILDQAAKENYESPIEKDGAIKSAIIQEFFALEANHSLLTATQKIALEEFKKLTKTVKDERAQEIYDSIFEPTFEALKRIKKAELLSKGIQDPSNVEAAYKEKLMGLAKKKYLGEK